MELQIENSGKTIKATLKGESISMQDTMEFKKQLSSAIAKNSPSKLAMYVSDAYMLPSAIVGALLKYKEIEKIDIELIVKKQELMNSLENLSLAEILNAKIGH